MATLGMSKNKKHEMKQIVLSQTVSLCPLCLKRISANYVKREKDVFLEKFCPDHGFFSTIVWRGHFNFKEWQGKELETKKEMNPECPKACGICAAHIQGTCCVVLEITKRCNLNCLFCFADGVKNSEESTCQNSEESTYQNSDKELNQTEISEPSLESLTKQLKKLAVPGKTLVQLSGGEPTIRDDLPEIIRAAKDAGCQYVQLNSNGIRLAEDKEFVRKLSEAGLSFVFMQFDGTEDEINRKLRGRDLLEIKHKAIENCAAYNIGVTLVPTIVPGVNTQNIGEILQFAIKESPAVRGVHFQPSSFFGRVPSMPTNEMRVTLDELLFEIVEQSAGLIKDENLLPSCCDHPLCGFHGDFVVTPDNGLKALSHRKKETINACSTTNAADKNRGFVARRWQREIFGETTSDEKNECGKSFSYDNSGQKPDIQDLDYFLKRVKSHGFTITSMVFQDAGNIDLKRLRQCSLHVFKENQLVPFCVNYLTGWRT